ncbi:MAG: S-layer homology domain-containing protein, partial [Faecousia sp.]
ELPKSAVQDIVSGTDAALTVKTGLGSVTVPTAGLKELAGQSGSTVTISAETVKDGDGNATGAVQIEIKVGGTVVEKLDSGLTVSIPAGEIGAGNVLVVVNSDGTETIVRKSVADGETVAGLVDGSCTVKIVDNRKTFSDVDDTYWGKDAIAFAASHELFNGTGANTFSPAEPMTRGMLVTVLYRLEDAKAEGENIFSDIESGLWYTDAVTWANKEGIVIGYGNGMFGPDDNITREQIAVMLYRYAGLQGIGTDTSGDLSRFSDAGQVSDYAADAVKWAVGCGLMNGKDNGIFDPTGAATRAEVAAIMQRLITLMVK